MSLSCIFTRNCYKSLEERLSLLSLNTFQIRERQCPRQNTPKLRHPTWFTHKTRVVHDDLITPANRDFLKEVVDDKLIKAESQVSLRLEPKEWNEKFQRTGVIARKIGVYPLWLKSGKKILTTLLQVLDNHVIKYYPPGEYDPPRKRPTLVRNKKGVLLLGAEATDPTYLTKEYCGLFRDSGVIPKKLLGRFFISPDAVIPTGSLITAKHFTVGNFVDVRGCTIDRGFQGVMKRHGFKGMPASHGVTKTHRRPGNIGGGGEKGRVWPGTKLPGHMGNRYRTQRGLKIWRINTKYNVLWVSGQAVPGQTNSVVYIYDTLLPLRKPAAPLPFPTYLGDGDELQEDIFDKEVHGFSEPSIEFNEEK